MLTINSLKNKIKIFENKILFRNFKIFIEKRNMSYSRKLMYKKMFLKMILFFKKPINQINIEDVKNLINFIYEKNYSKRKINHIKSLIKNILIWLGKENLIFFKIGKNKAIEKKIDILEFFEIKRMIENSESIFDKAVIAVLFDSASRSGEFRSCRIKDYNKENKTLLVNGKTGIRAIPLTFSYKYLEKWLEIHPNPDPNEFIWIKNGKVLDKERLLRLVKRIAKNTGIKKRVYVHLFRHSRITDLIKKGISDIMLKKFAGWEDGSPMTIYYFQMVPRDLIEYVNKLEGFKCPHCGGLVEKDDLYCKHCGYALKIDEIKKLKKEVNNLKKEIEILKLKRSCKK